MTCPACGRDAAVYGCVVREEGAFCHAPTPPPPPSSTPNAFRQAVRAFQKNAQPPVVGVEIGQKTADAIRNAIVTLPIPPSAPRVACGICGRLIVWIALPTARRIAVDAETREPHAARCGT